MRVYAGMECSQLFSLGIDQVGVWRMANGDRANHQHCPTCESDTVLTVSLEARSVSFVCFKCVHRWSIADRRSAIQAPFGGRERRNRLLNYET